MLEVCMPADEPDLDEFEQLPPAPRGQNSQRGNLVKSWVLWWISQDGAPSQKGARKALIQAMGERLSREQRTRWVRWAFEYLSDHPVTLRDVNAVRALITDKLMVVGGRASRASAALIPTAHDVHRLEASDLADLCKNAAVLGTLAVQGYNTVAKLMHLDKIPPDLAMSGQEVDDVLHFLERALPSFTDPQLDRLTAMTNAARISDVVDDLSRDAGL